MALRNADIQPILPCLEVRLEPVLLVPLEVGHVKSGFVEFVYVGQYVPRISNGVFLGSWSTLNGL